jgi:hypothetical protein
VPGSYLLASLGRGMASGASIGWSGKCFGREIEPATRTPTMLLNAFSPRFSDAATPQAERVPGRLGGAKGVYLDPSGRAGGRAAWAFDFSEAHQLPSAAICSRRGRTRERAWRSAM